MLISHAVRALRLNFTVLVFIVSCTSFFAIEDWRPVPASDFEVKRSEIDPDASAEILFSEQTASQSVIDTIEGDGNWITYDVSCVGTRSTYVRIKVFDELGVDMLTKHIVGSMLGEEVLEIAARTVKPDGTSIELAQSDIYDVVVEEDAYGKTDAKGFAFPSLQAGDIVEYQVSYDITDVPIVFTRFTDRFPTRRVYVRIKPAETAVHRIVATGFSQDMLALEDGEYSIVLENLRPELDEAYAIPEFHREPYLLMYYVPRFFPGTDEIFDWFSDILASAGRYGFRAKPAIKRKAKELSAGARDDREKLRRIWEFCVKDIENLSWEQDYAIESERNKLKKSENPVQTLKNGYGYPYQIRNLFGALLKAAGFDARYAVLPDKRYFYFSKSLPVVELFEEELIAVRDGESWLFFDPGNPALRFGEISWIHSASVCLIADSKKSILVNTPRIEAASAVVRTDARLHLSEEGTLSGRITKEFIGQMAYVEREKFKQLSLGEVERRLSESELHHYSAASVRQMEVTHRHDSEHPFIISYNIEIPNYADLAGERLIVSPALFHKELTVPFLKESRASDVVFDFPWVERGHIDIKLPEGYQFEAGDAPKPFRLGDVVLYDAKLQIDNRSGNIRFDREFQMNQDIIPVKAYALLKSAFETLKLEDSRALTLRLK